jgi:DNA-binding NarL/FixJ family response regulator
LASDSSFARLTEAWHASAGGRAMALAKRGLDALARSAGIAPKTERDGVLWLGVAPSESLPLAVSSLNGRMQNYRITYVQPPAQADLETLVHHHRPRFLVADVAWCASIGAPAVRRLHRHHPEVDWLLSWDAPSPRWLDTLLQSGARGAVLHGADEVALARAFDAVLAGEIWLPRQVMQWLYASLVDAPHQDSTTPSTISSAWPADSELTARESEVVGLMRHSLTNREIASRLGVSINTVKKHLGSAYEKHGLRSRRQALL